MKPNCYECAHRRDLPGDSHSSCHHPLSGLGKDELSDLLSILGGKRTSPVGMNNRGWWHLGIKGNNHGYRSGWFNWPYNFDPLWLEECNGFERKEKADADG